MTASLMMVRFHSSPQSPSAMALEFSATAGFAVPAVPAFAEVVGAGMCLPALDRVARCPAAVRAASDPLRQRSARDRPAAHVTGPEHDALGQIAVHVDGQRHQVGGVFAGTAGPWRHANLAAEDARLELVPLLATGRGVVLDQAVEQEPAGLVGGRVAIPVRPPAAPPGGGGAL